MTYEIGGGICDKTLDDLAKAFTAIYRGNNNIVSLELIYAHDKMEFSVPMDVCDTGHIFTLRNINTPDTICEGEKILLPNLYSLRSKEDQEKLLNLPQSVEAFVESDRRPYILKVLIAEKTLKVGVALIEF